jgi:hypothetical protein
MSDEVAMDSDKTPKTDRFQVMAAVLFMTLIAAVFLLVVMPKDNITSFVCTSIGNSAIFARICSDSPPLRPAGSSQIVASRIVSACLNREGLKISVAFDEPLTGASDIQVFTTGDDYFPSEQGISDSFKMNMTVHSAAGHLDFIIPVDAMPVGEQIFGNFFISDEGVSSFVAYSMNVTDCAITSAPPTGLAPNDTPTINSATCLPSRHLMIAFEFESHVLGQYRASVADRPYQLASVINQPATLFFSGEPPPTGPVVIRLVSATDEEVVFEETFTPPVCGAV